MIVVTGSGAGPSALAAADAALEQVAGGLGGQPPELVVAFIGGDYADEAEPIRQRIVERLAPRHVLGATAGGVIVDAREIEDPAALSLWAAHLPGAELTPLAWSPPLDRPADAGDLGWDPPPESAMGLIALADPFTFPADAFLSWLQHVRPGLPVSGGLASGSLRPGGNRLLLDGEVLEEGAVGIAVGGDVRLRTLVSQGCRPVGSSWVVTRAERNLLQELGGAPPVERIQETYADADPADRDLMRAGLQIGMVIDEYRDTFDRGDFLVRGVIGAEPETGAVAVGDIIEVGQTVQFHVRDADSADEDLRELLDRFSAEVDPPAGALLFTCNGRGARLFGSDSHDALLVREALGAPPVAGFFCAGEFGPVGQRAFLHGFTASIAVLEEVGAAASAQM
ncbi:MAG TPA: FIST N-terminal domain-containing protein [Egibacteraceae bacterium]|nr:FIST N-terminal domain-containing protein [Egibacteraceae bacterium]